ncbi:O-acetyl-ADP-ribose deacetylase [Baia soyae]|uniref:O-acetyl-ADP-ribose deacetylase (Regulator of RNase III) n=1 Tax=Baia soyae TaxID=1544746 RepID=A0A4R2SCK6_9BACL|nr:O-acetyl-ADP-ribose deacetylase [Baia soyae]TCP70646.1 O-acetyl-ADP-ribose deacetylase (regulator of RNase III) [Baia soyae]
MFQVKIENTYLTIVKGDIIEERVDVIVNAANTSLLGGSGVDGVIHRIGGSELKEDCQKIRARQGGCKVGEAVITRAGNLPANYVIHAVGPVWNGGQKKEEELLSHTYRNSLLLATEHQAKTISFTAISTGIYRFPKNLASEIALTTTLDFIREHEGALEEVRFILFDDESYQIYHQNIEILKLNM